MYDLVAYRKSNELCWYTEEKGEHLQLCVAGWRVPLPPPSRIRVVLLDRSEASGQKGAAAAQPEPASISPADKREDISVQLRRQPNGREAVRFDPVGPASQWPIGSLYLPKLLFGAKVPTTIWLTVEWMDLPVAEPVLEAVGAAS